MPLISSSNLTMPDGDGLHDALLQLTDGDLRSAHVFVERSQGMPRQKGQFNYGVGFGAILCALRLLLMPYELIPPQVWKRAAHLSSDKKASLDAAKRLFPGTDHFKLAKHEGRAEAALIARHGWAKRAMT